MDVQDPAITVLFDLIDEDASIAAWTTTPWTLPSNLALCVGADIEYVLVHDKELDKKIYIAAERLSAYGELEVLERVPGTALVGKQWFIALPNQCLELHWLGSAINHCFPILRTSKSKVPFRWLRMIM